MLNDKCIFASLIRDEIQEYLSFNRHQEGLKLASATSSST
jgi:hypothetical protein